MFEPDIKANAETLTRETHFLENIKPQVLLDVKHCYFYPRTTFKFMSRDDIRKAKAVILYN